MNRQTIYILITFLLITLSKQAIYEKRTYISYTPAVGGSSDYHKLELVWSTAAITANTNDSSPETWKYSVLTTDGITPSASSNNGNTVYDRYVNYLIEPTGYHASKNYVAWDIVGACASSKVTLTLKIKYFNCGDAALNFYNGLAVTITEKVYSSTTAVITKTGTSNGGTAVENLLGISTTFVASCT